MWYLLAGNLISLLVFIVMSNVLQNFNQISDIESSIGWFLIEHIFEEYNLTTGKFFLVSNDFRTLIKNFIMIIRNIIFLAQAFTPLEFFIINMFLVCILIVYKKTRFYNIIKLCVFISYYFLFKSFLFFDYYLIFVLCKNFCFTILNLVTFFFYIFLLYWVLTLKKSKVKQLIQIILIKIFLYLFIGIIIFNLVLHITILLLLIKTQENILQEVCLNIFIIYSYFLYI